MAIVDWDGIEKTIREQNRLPIGKPVFEIPIEYLSVTTGNDPRVYITIEGLMAAGRQACGAISKPETAE